MKLLHRRASLRDLSLRSAGFDHERYERARKGRTKSTGQQTDYVWKLKTALQTYW